MLSLTWLVLLALLIIKIKTTPPIKKKIGCGETIRLINKENAIVIDIRKECEYKRGHIVNSINMTHDEVKKKAYKYLKSRESSKIILVSKTGVNLDVTTYSGQVSEVCILKGGIDAWEKENLPLVLK